MTLSGSRAAYPDCFDLFDRAMASPRGVQKRCQTRHEAEHLRGRLNKARQVDRRENTRIYINEPDHYLYDNSEFYALTVSVEEDEKGWVVKLAKKRLIEGVEEIPEPVIIDNLPIPPRYTEVFKLTMETEDEPGEDMEPSPQGGGRDRRF